MKDEHQFQRGPVGESAGSGYGQGIKFDYDVKRTTRQCVKDILAAARQTSKEGPVAQYLIGAKLKLRFPDKESMLIEIPANLVGKDD